MPIKKPTDDEVKPESPMKRLSTDMVKVKNKGNITLNTSKGGIPAGGEGEVTFAEYCNFHKKLELVK